MGSKRIPENEVKRTAILPRSAGLLIYLASGHTRAMS